MYLENILLTANGHTCKYCPVVLVEVVLYQWSYSGLGGPKLQRITAPRHPVGVITTSSWRSGQETVKRILGPSKKPRSSQPQSIASQGADASSSNGSDLTASKGFNLEWKGQGENKKEDEEDSAAGRKQGRDSVDHGEPKGPHPWSRMYKPPPSPLPLSLSL